MKFYSAEAENLEIESKIKLFQACRIIEIAILCYG